MPLLVMTGLAGIMRASQMGGAWSASMSAQTGHVGSHCLAVNVDQGPITSMHMKRRQAREPDLLGFLWPKVFAQDRTF